MATPSHGRVAQLAEHAPEKRGVTGSTPVPTTRVARACEGLLSLVMMRLRAEVAQLLRPKALSSGVALVYALIVGSRGAAGIDRIPNDPGYEYVLGRFREGLRIGEVKPYLYVDQALAASVASRFPIMFHALVLNIISHAVWVVAAFFIFHALKRLSLPDVVAACGGLALVLSPWAAESSLGNYGNMRWALLAGAVVMVSVETSQSRPSATRLIGGTAIACLSNPLSLVLLVPLGVRLVSKSTSSRGVTSLASAMVAATLLINTLTSGGAGHGTTIRRFWSGAGFFWLSGQILPGLGAVIGLIVVLFFWRRLDTFGPLAAVLFMSTLVLVASSYYLGGIADRYFTTPAATCAVGFLTMSPILRNARSLAWRVVLAVVVLIIAVPVSRYFFVQPWLTTGPSWTQQVRDARERCSSGDIESVRLVPSAGDGETDDIDCKYLD